MQLGLWLEIRPTDDLSRLADRVAAIGFSTLHAHFPDGCDEALARRLVRACATGGLGLAAVSGYANPLRPDEAPMGSTLAQLADLAALTPLLDTRRVVTWSGSFGAGLLDDHPDNHAGAGWDALRRGVDALFPVLEEAEAVLLLEPYFTHVLDSPAAVARFCEELNTPYVGAVLDPPNLLPPDTWGRQAELIPAGVAAMARHIGLVHLKDMRLRDGALELPGPGQGVLDYGAFLGAVRALGTAVPLIVEHVALEGAAAARHFVLAHGREV
ncbi:MAG TPA: sugar phosphate isomerase/epimerase [Chloroflexaceae bacterium]|nr:sugar phosphate isomerase/epimerase [Chloroflexaceae bacterium]